MTRTLVLQSFRAHDTPAWIARCLASVRGWAAAQGHDYRLTGDEVFELCGSDYLARVGGNLRSITNLARLELVRRAHAEGYDFAAWVDADVLVFAPAAFSLEGVRRYAFARETWVDWRGERQWFGFAGVNNSVFACRRGEPDLDFLIAATRHVALHRPLRSNYQVGGDLIKGLRASLDFEMLDDVGMLSNYVVLALARGAEALLRAQARLHGAPIHAANLCASGNYEPLVSETEAMRAIDVLERDGGEAINRWADGAARLAPGAVARFESAELERLLAPAS